MRHIPEAGAVCVNCARTDLCGGRGVTSVPTVTNSGGLFECSWIDVPLAMILRTHLYPFCNATELRWHAEFRTKELPKCCLMIAWQAEGNV